MGTALVFVTVGVGLAVASVSRRPFTGSIITGVAFLLAAALRLAAPARSTMWITARSRYADAAVLGLLGAGCIGLSLSLRGAHG